MNETTLFVNVLGGNSSRKTTKVDCLFNYIRKHAEKFEKIPYGYIMTYNGINYCFVGKIIKDVFMGLDSRPFGEKAGANSYENKLKTYEKIIKEYNPYFIMTEGYFNNGGSFQYECLENIQKYGFSGYRYFYHLFDSFEEQVKNIRIRNDVYETHLKRSEHNYLYLTKTIEKFKKDVRDGNDVVVQKVSPFVENDYYVKFFFNTEFPEYKIKNSNDDDLSDF